jgi:hypothetical protein
MEDVTDIFQLYRLSLREIWNRAFWSDPELRTWNSAHHFQALKPHLFRALVTEKLDRDACCLTGNAADGRRFYIVPSIPSAGDDTRSAQVTILHEKPEGGWDWDRQVVLKSSEVTMMFVDFFDWGLLGYRDLRYYLVKISHSNTPELVGRAALVDVYDATVMTED